MLRVLPIIVCLLAVLGCARDPVRDFQRWADATAKGDRAGFRQGLTQRSRAFVDGLWTMRSKHPRLDLPRTFAGKVRVITAPKRAQIRGNRAWIEVESAGRRERLLLIKEDGRWRLDLFLLVRIMAP